MVLIRVSHVIPNVKGKFNSDTILTGVPESVRPPGWLSLYKGGFYFGGYYLNIYRKKRVAARVLEAVDCVD